MTNQIELSPDALGNLLREQEPQRVPPDMADTVRVSPIDGQVIDITNVDELADAFELANLANDTLQRWRGVLKERLAALREGDQKTQRVRGQRRIVKITGPSEKIDNTILKEAWNSYPDLRDEFLRIEKIAIKKREFAKAAVTSGTDSFNNFVGMIRSAISEPTSLSTVTIEK